MGLFKPALDKFSSKAFVLPNNDYELEIGTLKTKSVDIRNGERAGQKMHMVNVPFRVVSSADGDTEFANKLVTIDFIVNTDQEDGFNRVLKLAMAANGIIPGSDEGDREFVSQYGNEDWSIDFDENKIGTAWAMLNKKRIIAQIVIGGKTEYPRNEIKGNPRPI